MGQVTDTVLKLIYLYNRLTDLKKKKTYNFPPLPEYGWDEFAQQLESLGLSDPRN